MKGEVQHRARLSTLGLSRRRGGGGGAMVAMLLVCSVIRSVWTRRSLRSPRGKAFAGHRAIQGHGCNHARKAQRPVNSGCSNGGAGLATDKRMSALPGGATLNLISLLISGLVSGWPVIVE